MHFNGVKVSNTVSLQTNMYIYQIKRISHGLQAFTALNFKDKNLQVAAQNDKMEVIQVCVFIFTTAVLSSSVVNLCRKILSGRA